jgi:hypothetical protein
MHFIITHQKTLAFFISKKRSIITKEKTGEHFWRQHKVKNSTTTFVVQHDMKKKATCSCVSIWLAHMPVLTASTFASNDTAPLSSMTTLQRTEMLHACDKSSASALGTATHTLMQT